jgi:dihydroorotase
MQAVAYRDRILDALPPALRGGFTPLMTCYLTDLTTPADVAAAKAAGVVAFKLYPAGTPLCLHACTLHCSCQEPHVVMPAHERCALQ